MENGRTNCSIQTQGVGVGFVANGILEVNLKEQEGTFYGDEINTRLGEGQEGCSSHWLQHVQSHWGLRALRMSGHLGWDVWEGGMGPGAQGC